MPDYYNDPFGRKKESATSALLNVLEERSFESLKEHILTMMATTGYDDAANILSKAIVHLVEEAHRVHCTHSNAIQGVINFLHEQEGFDKDMAIELLFIAHKEVVAILNIKRPI